MSTADLSAFQSIRWTAGEVTISRKTLVASAALALIVTVFFAINIRWVWLYRHGQPLDIDEAGYLRLAVIDYLGFVRGGVLGWLSAINGPSDQAPLLPALTSFLFIVFGPHLILGFVATTICGTLLLIATYMLAREIGSNRTAILATCLVSCVPTVVMFTRSFQFSIPATLMATLALFCLLKSERMKSWRWAVAFGLCLGMVPLARTMAIAFMPGIALGAVVYVLVDPLDRKRRLLNLITAFALACLVAAIWYVPNGKYVFTYLLNFGYGARAADYGPKVSLFSLASWHLTIKEFLDFYGRLPHSLFILLGLTAGAINLSSMFLRNGVRVGLRRALMSPVLPVFIFILSGYAALTSSSNRGSAFVAPIVPAVIVVAVWSLSQFTGRASRLLTTAAVLLVTLIATYPALDLRNGSVWSVGYYPVSDPRGVIQFYEQNFQGTAIEPIPPAVGRDWIKLSADFAEMQKSSPGLILGMRHALFNLNTIGLFENLNNERMAPLYPIDPVVTEPTVSAYVQWLTTEPVSSGCLLVTATTSNGDFFQPGVNGDYMAVAAKQVGFANTKRLQMPNKQELLLWRRVSCRSH